MRISAVAAAPVAVALSLPMAATAAPSAATEDLPVVKRVDVSVRVPVGKRASDSIQVSPVGPVGSVVMVQQLDEDLQWQTIRKFRARGQSTVTLIYPKAVLGTQQYRVVPAAGQPQELGEPVMVTVTGYQPRASLQGWSAGTVFVRKGTRQGIDLVASPAGATALLQSRGARGGWRDVAARTVRADGSLRVNPGRASARTVRYRVVIPRQELVGQKYTSDVRTVVGYGRVPPTEMLPELLNRLVTPLGIPGVSSSSVSSPTTARSACVAAELSGLGPSRSQPGRTLRARLLGSRSLRSAPQGMLTGINVSVRCQAAYFVSGGRVLRAVPVSTGQAGYRTDVGTHRIYRSVNGVETSREFPDDHWNMYRSLYFNGGEAIHGSFSDSYVRTYPDSHGCVRMLHRDVDWLWRNGWTMGTTVRVYGSWT